VEKEKGRGRRKLGALEHDDFDDHAAWAVGEWPDLDPDVETIVSRVGHADRYIERASVDTLATLGLTHGELKVLLRLSRGKRSHGKMAKDLLVSTGTMTNRLDKLEAAGIVARHPDPDDRRGVIVELTESGRKVLDSYVTIQGRRERQLLSEMSPEDRRELTRLLRKLLSSIESQADAAMGIKD